jgi:hypothetical protein
LNGPAIRISSFAVKSAARTTPAARAYHSHGRMGLSGGASRRGDGWTTASATERSSACTSASLAETLAACASASRPDLSFTLTSASVPVLREESRLDDSRREDSRLEDSRLEESRLEDSGLEDFRLDASRMVDSLLDEDFPAVMGLAIAAAACAVVSRSEDSRGPISRWIRRRIFTTTSPQASRIVSGARLSMK